MGVDLPGIDRIGPFRNCTAEGGCRRHRCCWCWRSRCRDDCGIRRCCCLLLSTMFVLLELSRTSKSDSSNVISSDNDAKTPNRIHVCVSPPPRIAVMDADVTIGGIGSLKADLIGAVSFDATYVYFNKVRVRANRPLSHPRMSFDKRQSTLGSDGVGHQFDRSTKYTSSAHAPTHTEILHERAEARIKHQHRELLISHLPFWLKMACGLFATPGWQRCRIIRNPSTRPKSIKEAQTPDTAVRCQ